MSATQTEGVIFEYGDNRILVITDLEGRTTKQFITFENTTYDHYVVFDIDCVGGIIEALQEIRQEPTAYPCSNCGDNREGKVSMFREGGLIFCDDSCANAYEENYE